MDTGFEDVIAGEVYKHPDDVVMPLEAPEPPEPALESTITATVTIQPAPPLEPHVCANATGGITCDKCFALLVAAPEKKPTPASPPTSTASPTSSGLTPAGVQAALALVRLPKLDWPTLAQLAREMAMNLKPKSDVLHDYKLTQVQYDFLEENNEFYRAALGAACKEWHAPMSTAERIKVEAAAILEDSLLGIGARMQNKGEGLPGVIEAAKLFAKIAEVGERASGNISSGERVTINIDLGGDTKVSVAVAPAPQSDGNLSDALALSLDT